MVADKPAPDVLGDDVDVLKAMIEARDRALKLLAPDLARAIVQSVTVAPGDTLAVIVRKEIPNSVLAQAASAIRQILGSQSHVILASGEDAIRLEVTPGPAKRVSR